MTSVAGSAGQLPAPRVRDRAPPREGAGTLAREGAGVLPAECGGILSSGTLAPQGRGALPPIGPPVRTVARPSGGTRAASRAGGAWH